MLEAVANGDRNLRVTDRPGRRPRRARIFWGSGQKLLRARSDWMAAMAGSDLFTSWA